ncbi:hypothetical protein EST38_g2827 [Candolleomyces aberdarensis]|uniref:Uncharacterized protein n=1 Tax=Candolleomyces aberdarensis TaxID=2316362 RepID=A0A4Q2DUL6_9AGAR|nr:hypothetical protein EST38_g2827 [Candolleomyces aberdarensis]
MSLLSDTGCKLTPAKPPQRDQNSQAPCLWGQSQEASTQHDQLRAGALHISSCQRCAAGSITVGMLNQNKHGDGRCKYSGVKQRVRKLKETEVEKEKKRQESMRAELQSLTNKLEKLTGKVEKHEGTTLPDLEEQLGLVERDIEEQERLLMQMEMNREFEDVSRLVLSSVDQKQQQVLPAVTLSPTTATPTNSYHPTSQYYPNFGGEHTHHQAGYVPVQQRAMPRRQSLGAPSPQQQQPSSVVAKSDGVYVYALVFVDFSGTEYLESPFVGQDDNCESFEFFALSTPTPTSATRSLSEGCYDCTVWSDAFVFPFDCNTIKSGSEPRCDSGGRAVG